ncbi:MAG: wax ester/triacylglycerol synthase family O-acyltransferase [Solirubrobacteraceae bacterium]|jgi:WS/DGAT/MGAT family acyltransferase|nr:wax ester/triacylglycerol synthase family O-acyltransferase [Solirubrobacteraceae bacterium]
MAPTRLGPLDATFLHVEDGVSHMHIGSISLFAGPAPSEHELLRVIEAHLHRAPRYRQCVRFVPLQAGRPVWVDDPHFRLGYHVRRTALPAPGGDEELRRLVGRVMSQQLDRHRPLWEMWVAEGMSGGRWAVIVKMHHAMVDGISGSDLSTLVLDERPDAEAGPPQPWSPEPAPGDARLVADALAERLRLPLDEGRAALRALADPLGSAQAALDVAHGLAAYAGLLRAPAATLLNGPIGPHRRWRWARARVAEVKEIRSALGGTGNDVVLAAIAGGLRELLLAAGEPVPETVRTMVPVSVRARGEHGVFDNQVSTMFADLPVGLADPVARLDAVHAQLRHLKGTHEAEAGRALVHLEGLLPEIVLLLGGRAVTGRAQRTVNTVTTNVPGPPHTLYFAGRRMLETFPYVPIAGHLRIGIAIYSYDGAIAFGITADDEAAPDLGPLCGGIERGIADLLEAARHKQAGRSRRRRATGAAREREPGDRPARSGRTRP